MSAKDDLRARVADLPDAPGVYLLKDASGKVLYVGKATSLRSRVRSYLQGAEDRPHLAPFLKRWRGLQVITTRTASEALVLENSFIKKERPPGNVMLRDDKRYLCVRVDLRHEFPRIRLVRRFRNDGALYFGPYANAGALRQTLRALRELYPLRSCSDHVLTSIPAPCLYYQLARCAAPCHGHVSRERYTELVGQALSFLRGRQREVIDALETRMHTESEQLRFEAAGRIRDRIRALERTIEKQTVAIPDEVDRDVIALERGEKLALAVVLFIRDGALVSVREVPLPRAVGADSTVLYSFLGQFYDTTKYVPTEVLVPVVPDETELLSEYLSGLRGAKVQVRVPQRGVGRELMEMARRNASLALRTHRKDERAVREALAILAERLSLPGPPAIIECFDVSHLQGREVVASMVRFVDGKADRSGYRHYRIREILANDDFASMNEVFRRRYKGVVQDEVSESSLSRPDLIVVDGGKGQLSAARQALEAVGYTDAPVVSLAKARAGRDGLQRFERVFLPGASEPIVPPQDGPETLLLARIRDEAHRFAIRYHRKLRSKAAVESALDRIEGVGEGWRRKLLRRFGSVKGVREASLDELMAVPGIGRKRALRIQEHLGEQ